MNMINSMINSMQIRERSDGRLEGRLTIKGKRKGFYGKTKAEVRNKAKEYLSKVEQGYVEPKNITVAEYMKYWLKTYKWEKTEPSTYSQYLSCYKYWVNPVIGNMKIGDIGYKDMQDFLEAYANPKCKRFKGKMLSPLAEGTLRRLMALLYGMFKTAIKEGVISKNPCTDIIYPKQEFFDKERKVQFSLTDDEIQRFKEVAINWEFMQGTRHSRSGLMLLLLLNLGLRIGEASALKWEDIDFKSRFINITKTAQTHMRTLNDLGEFSNDNKKYQSRIRQSTKTSAGMRKLYINDEVFNYLNMLREHDKKYDIQSDLVFCSNSGTLINPDNLRRTLNAIVEKSNIERHVTLHTLRHTFGSTLLRRGTPIEVVSRLMGHKNVNITYGTYIHVIEEEKAKYMNNITIC